MRAHSCAFAVDAQILPNHIRVHSRVFAVKKTKPAEPPGAFAVDSFRGLPMIGGVVQRNGEPVSPHEPPRLIARCAWLASQGEDQRYGEAFVRNALLHVVLRGQDVRPLAHDSLEALRAEGRVRVQGGRLAPGVRGDDFARLEELTDRLRERLRIEFYASLIGQTSEATAARCERRALGLLALAERLGRESTKREAMLVMQAAFLYEIDQLIALPGAAPARDAANCIDHFYSQFVRLRARAASPYASPRPTGAEVKWEKLAPGLRHGELSGVYRFGPLRADILEISPKKWRLRAVAAPDEPVLANVAAAGGARFAVSGGFALAADDDPGPGRRVGEPVGLLVCDGEVVGAPAYNRTALLMDVEGLVDIWRVGPIGLRLHIRRATAVARKVDSERLQPGEIALYTNAFKKKVPPAALYLSVQGRRVVDVLHEAGAAPPPGGFLLAIAPGPAGLGPFAEIEPQDPVRYELPAMRGLGSIDAAVAGGPALLADGLYDGDLAADGFDGEAPPQAFGPRTRAAQNLLPRVAWGITADHRLFAVAVGGRRPQESVGIDLTELAKLLRELGCVRAVNMDGGAASMLIDGRPIEAAPLDDVLADGEPAEPRPLGSAILIVERT
jgi:hypothetical protein